MLMGLCRAAKKRGVRRGVQSGPDAVSAKEQRYGSGLDSFCIRVSTIVLIILLQECLLSRSNAGYIRRALPDLLSWLAAEVDRLPFPEANHAITECLGAIGYALDNDFRRFFSWVFDYFPSLENEEQKIPYLQALRQVRTS